MKVIRIETIYTRTDLIINAKKTSTFDFTLFEQILFFLQTRCSEIKEADLFIKATEK